MKAAGSLLSSLLLSVSVSLKIQRNPLTMNSGTKVVLYENPENETLSKFALTGRLQADYHSFENDVDGSSEDDSQWRRFRFGFKATLFDGITLHSEANMNLNQPEPLYRNLTDTYLSWSTDSGMKVKVGKQSALFTLHGSTSSKKLYTLERGKVARNIWFTNEYFTGASISGSRENWDYSRWRLF